MKILHFFDVATVASTLAIYQRERGHKVDVVSRCVIDGVPFVFPDIINLNSGIYLDVLNMIRLARTYDILHVHSNLFMAKLLQRIYRKKHVVLTCHGNDVRNISVSLPKVDVLTYATPDLVDHLPSYAEYIPNTVNMDLFSRRFPYKKGTILYMSDGKGHESAAEAALMNANVLNLTLSVYQKHFSYNFMPYLLERFEYYDEVKVDVTGYTKWLKFLSLMALQILSLGGKVHYYGKIITELPQQHTPVSVIQKWNEVYQK